MSFGSGTDKTVNFCIDEKTLQEIVTNGNIEMLDRLKETMVKDKKKKQILEQHPYGIYQTKKGWATRYKNKDGKTVTKMLTRKSDLENFLVKHYEELETHKNFVQAYQEMIEEKREFGENRESSITRYNTDFKRFFPENDHFCKIDLRDITEADLERHIKKCIRDFNLTRKTYSGLRTIIKSTLKFAKRQHYTNFSVSSFFGDLTLPDSIFQHKAPKNAKNEVYTDAESEKLKMYFQQNPSLIHLGLTLMLDSGLRIGELSALTTEYVNVKEPSVTIAATEVAFDDENSKRIVTVQDEPKTENGYRKVFLPKSSIKTILAINKMNPFQHWLFCYEDGRRIRSKAFRDALREACKKCGIKYRSPHKIRKTYASRLIDAGVNRKIIKEQLGHTDFATTEKYYDWDRSDDDTKLSEINRAINH